MVAVLDVAGLDVSLPGGQKLLDGLTLRLDEGERVGLVGASGCGKSLTAAALCGLLRAPVRLSAGQLRLTGQDLANAAPATWRRLRGRAVFQIFQSPATALTPARRVLPQLVEAARIAGVDPAPAIGAALERVALPAYVGAQFPYQLSGGMKQRVLIAMALILRPRLLIADEPTTGLDVLTERGVLEALGAMADETGAALLFISHDLRAVRTVARRVLVMDAGRLVADAGIDALGRVEAPAARRLWEAAHALQPGC
jgi:peptide/nickel transport system ATP-binding protein